MSWLEPDPVTSLPGGNDMVCAIDSSLILGT
jgi:hypothetical protein